MGNSKQAEQWLDQVLATEQRPITFRELAREIGCHVHLAKNLLNSYLVTHPEVEATFLISGPLLESSSVGHTNLEAPDAPAATQSLAHLSATQKVRIVDMDVLSDDERNSEADDEEEREEEALEESSELMEDEAEMSLRSTNHPDHVSRWGVVLVNADDLDEKRKLFEPGADVHVYAITPAPLKDPAHLFTAAFALRKRPSQVNADTYGSITGDAHIAPAKPMRDGAIDFGAKGKAKTPVEVKPVKLEKESPPSTSKPPSTQGTLPKPAPKTTTKSKRRVITSDDEGDQTDKTVEPQTKSKATLQPTSSMVRAEDQAAMEAIMGMDIDDFDDDDEPAPPKPVKSRSAEGKKRKRRQVKKSKTEMDDRGYMVTKDYYTDESYSGSDTDAGAEGLDTKSVASSKTKPTGKVKEPMRSASNASMSESSSSKSGQASSNKTGAPKGQTKKAAPRGQSTLAGFFTKK